MCEREIKRDRKRRKRKRERERPTNQRRKCSFNYDKSTAAFGATDCYIRSFGIVLSILSITR